MGKQITTQYHKRNDSVECQSSKNHNKKLDVSKYKVQKLV